MFLGLISIQLTKFSILLPLALEVACIELNSNLYRCMQPTPLSKWVYFCLALVCNLQRGRSLNGDCVLHNTSAVCPKLVWPEKGWRHSSHPLQETVVSSKSLVCTKMTRDYQSQHSEVCFLLLEWSITGSNDSKDLSSIPGTLHNPLEIPFTEHMAPSRPVRSWAWVKVYFSDVLSPVVLVTDLTQLKSLLW